MEIQTSKLIEIIKGRKSIKHFTFKKLNQQLIKEILECGRFALEENISQPYRVNVVTHPTVRMMLAETFPEYADIFETASCCFVIFLDLSRSDNRTKDILAIGAFIENILLAVYASPQIGSVLLNINLEQKEKINEIFKLSIKHFELIDIIAVGAIDEEIQKAKPQKKITKRSTEEFTDWF